MTLFLPEYREQVGSALTPTAGGPFLPPSLGRDRRFSLSGTGLGLAIVKHVLARHQGKLLIQSEIGGGSVFSVNFPGQRICVSP
ncbi:MAG: hypothetical protein HY847_05685 [Betaproteobacteria bacterium]|nr:hypothetical protein [Betaproteobacteria bacterium]